MFKLGEWTISDTGTNDSEIITNGNRFIIGNGYLGYRGTVEEADASYLPATIVNGLYDKQGTKWREPVNLPNPIVVRLYTLHEELLSIKSPHLISHEQQLNFKYGIFSRKSNWRINEVTVSVQSERFASMVDIRRLYQKYTVTADKSVDLRIERGIDGTVHDINGPHLIQFECSSIENKMILLCKTQERGIPIQIISEGFVEGRSFRKQIKDQPLKTTFSAETIYIHLEANEVFTLYCNAQMFIGSTEVAYEADCLLRKDHGRSLYTKALQIHKERWDKIWLDGDVKIEGDPISQSQVRYNLYQLHIIAPRHANALSIPARGLSGQTYKGAVFWDTEQFISHYFLSTDPVVANSFINYRIQTLPGAKRKAQEYGYLGAFYAWESQESGDDACSHFNVVDVFTGRPQRTYFRDKQIHISADVVYLIKRYCDVTGDFTLLRNGALEVIVNCALFYISYIVYVPAKQRYEIRDVTGPDEYHERVNNNAFTNIIILFTLKTAADYLEYYDKEDTSFYKEIIEKTGIEPYLQIIEDIIKKLYIPEPNSEGIIEQFDDYFKLEDIDIDNLKKRLLDPKEYWGGANGIASHTQIIKQADVVAMLYLFKDDYSEFIKRNNLLFYESRTEHGSSLSASMHALLYCDINEPDKAFNYFKKTAETDLTGESKQFAGLIYIGGTHPAANGGTWMSVVYGFCGYSVKNGVIQVNPRLPREWRSVSFVSYVKGKRYTITVTKDGYTIC
ncbi:glycosyl hydrolase family 65 protein [Gracilinema caldarium]|uniref:glycosyl hydrolase family 65 protein n=1 Tax=Gracilinema caldarium TaxID=215591 RepID=UPI0026F2949F|nr:glycosyl hydrolase family 65 protein [Gracilinema caldarium]